MRPGLNRPGKQFTGLDLRAVVPSFNEARAESPGKAARTSPTASPSPPRFNEARAESPGKALGPVAVNPGVLASMRPGLNRPGKNDGYRSRRPVFAASMRPGLNRPGKGPVPVGGTLSLTLLQ